MTPSGQGVMSEYDLPIMNNSQLLKRIVRAGIVENIYLIAQRQGFFDEFEGSGNPVDDFIGWNVVAAFVDSLRDTRLIERWVAQVNEYQDDFITECLCLGNKVDFRRVREYGFKTEAAALPQKLQAQVFRQFGGMIAVCFRCLRIQQLGDDVRIYKRQTARRKPGTVKSAFTCTVASSQQPKLFFLVQRCDASIAMNSPP